MNTKIIKYSTSFWLNNYLSDLDLLTKYQIKTTFNLPKIKKIILSLNLKKSLFDGSTKKNINNNYTFNLLYLFIYSILSILPFIKATSISTLKNISKNIDTNFSLIITCKTKQQIELFLLLYFIEAWTILKKNGYKFQFQHPFLFSMHKDIILNSKIPFISLNNFNLFFNLNSNFLIKEDSTLFISFVFTNLISSNIKKSIKNLPFFWKNC